MDIIQAIIDTFGGPTDLATATAFPVQTVDSWNANGNIPHWRRAAIIDAAKREGKNIPPDALVYLTSKDTLPRRNKVRRAAPEQAAA